MKNLYLSRIFSFLLDTFFWVSFWLFFQKVFFYFFEENLNNVFIAIFSFVFVFNLFYLISYRYFNGWSPGNQLFGLKLISLKDNNISWTQSIFRVFLNIFDFLTAFTNREFNPKKYFYQTFVEIFSKTAFIKKNISIEEEEKLKKEIFVDKSFIIYFLIKVSLFFGVFIYFLFLIQQDINKGAEEIQQELFINIEKTLLKSHLNDIEKNQKIKHCVWNYGDNIGNYPTDILKLYLSEGKDREENLKKLDKILEECVHKYY